MRYLGFHLDVVGVVLLMVPITWAFYLPGVAPHAYMQDEGIPVLVNRLDSPESLVPFDYYSFDFCKIGQELSHPDMKIPKANPKVSENLGQILLGERIFHSIYDIKMKTDVRCVPLCKAKTYDLLTKENEKAFRRLQYAIKKEYFHHWIADNLPVVECIDQCNYVDLPVYRLGFPLGCASGDASSKRPSVCTSVNRLNMQPGKLYLNNHIDFTVSFHESVEFEGSRIVGVEARPRSISHRSLETLDCSLNADPLEFVTSKENPLNVIYTYSVVFKPSEIKWASRWDAYLKSSSSNVHWFSIVNSLIVVFFLSAMIGVILVRTLRRDITRYNQNEDAEEAQEEFGWKLIHGDVFRAPSNPMLFSMIVGNGTQVLLMVIVTLVFACLGFLSPATRGGLVTSALVLYILFSSLAGYITARIYKMFGGQRWRNCIMISAVLFTFIIFGIFFVLNLILWTSGSSAAVPFGTMIALILLWFGLSVPLTFVGAYYGFKEEVIVNPVRTNQIPRQIPDQRWFNSSRFAVLVGGLLPFGSVFVQLYFIFSSLWGENLYYVFGFLSLVFVIWGITTMQSTILLIYFSLCAENYHWWWKSIDTAFSAGFYFIFYSIIYYFRQMEADGLLNLLIFVGYTAIITILFFLTTAAIGFFGTFVFLRTIYSSIKVD